MTAAATASQQLSQSGKSPGPSRPGTKYPVQEALTSTNVDRREGFLNEIFGPWAMDQRSCQIGRVGGTLPPPSPGNSGWHSGQETILEVFTLGFDSYERYLDFETGVLHRISSRIYLAE